MAYDICARALVRECAGYNLAPKFKGTIYADGFSTNRPGPNVDPNVLSDLIPWFHAFCQISSSKCAYHVLPKTAVLSELVRPGDLIFYGGAISTHLLYIDAVLCVGARIRLPERNGKFRLHEQMAKLIPDLGIDTPVTAFRRSLTYRFCLRDAEPERGHYRTGLSPHRMIVGRRDTSDWAVGITPNALVEAFLDGAGFNFIPLRAQSPSTNQSVLRRVGLYVTRVTGAKDICSRKASHIEGETLKSLLHAVFSESDRLVLDPVQAVAVRAG